MSFCELYPSYPGTNPLLDAQLSGRFLAGTTRVRLWYQPILGVKCGLWDLTGAKSFSEREVLLTLSVLIVPQIYFGCARPPRKFLLYSQPMTILDKILEEKRIELEIQTREQPFAQVRKVASSRYQPRGFAAAIRSAGRPAVIAEIKRGSPSRGIFRRSLDPIEAAQAFARADACCLSILTDVKFFAGSLSCVPLVRDHLGKAGLEIPLLRKDFIIDPYQVWQSRAIGADAILLILAALDDAQFAQLLSTGIEAELDVLVEVHNAEELQRAVSGIQQVYADSEGRTEVVLGINNRDLHSFVTDLAVTEILAAKAFHLLQESPEKMHTIQLISESGISTRADIDRLLACGVDGFLVGEAIVAKGDLEENLRTLRTEVSSAPSE